MNVERRAMRNRIGIVVLTVLSGMTPLAAPQAPKATVPRDPEMIDAQGYQKLLEQYRGKPLLVTFWATWCEPCRDEYPMLNELAKQYAPQGLKVVGVSLDDDGDLILMRRFLARTSPSSPTTEKRREERKPSGNWCCPGGPDRFRLRFFTRKMAVKSGMFWAKENEKPMRRRFERCSLPDRIRTNRRQGFDRLCAI